MLQLSKTRLEKGFTLIELLLAMAFISMIFLLISTVTMQLMAIYNRGIAMKQIDQAGTSIMSDINQIANSGMGGSITQGNGFLCVSGTKYFWNSQSSLSSDPIHDLYVFNGDPSQEVGIVRSDIGAPNSPSCSSATYTNTSVDPGSVTRLVGDNVRLIDLTVSYSPGNNSLAQISLTIGTYSTDPTSRPFMQDSHYQCPPSGLGNFCAVATYKTVVYLPNNPS